MERLGRHRLSALKDKDPFVIGVLVLLGVLADRDFHVWIAVMVTMVVTGIGWRGYKRFARRFTKPS